MVFNDDLTLNHPRICRKLRSSGVHGQGAGKGGKSAHRAEEVPCGCPSAGVFADQTRHIIFVVQMPVYVHMYIYIYI